MRRGRRGGAAAAPLGESRRGLGRCPAPSDGPGRFKSRPRVAPGVAFTGSDTITRPWAGVHSAAPPGPPTPRSIRLLSGPALPQEPGAGCSFPRPRPRPAPRRFHLRGAPVAEFVGDGLDAPGPGHCDVAALGAHVQPHHRHDWLAVRLRPGSGCASSGRCARLPQGPTAPRSLRAPASRDSGGSQRLTRRQAAPILRGQLRRRPGSATAGSPLRAPVPTQKGRSQLLSFMYRTDQKFPESAAFTHRRLHRPLHVPLPLPSSRAFSKDSTQWGPGPCRDDRRCHGAGEPLRSYWLSRPAPPPSLPAPGSWLLIQRTMNKDSKNRHLRSLLVGNAVRPPDSNERLRGGRGRRKPPS